MALDVQLNVVASLAACLGLSAALVAVTKWYRRREWHEGGQVKGIFVYPIKSLPPLEVNFAELTKEGLMYEGVKDREFLILDVGRNNGFITARHEPSLLLLDTSYHNTQNCLIIRSKNPEKDMEPLEITVDENQGVDTSVVLQVQTWTKNGFYRANPCDQKVSAWFSEYLGKDIIVVRLIPSARARSKESPDRFQDTAGLNMLSERSVENLVDLIQDPSANVTFRNFRTSLLIETKYPFEEDFWCRAKIGHAETEFHSRCHRCVLTTIDPDTGVKTGREPLTTLRKFRVDRSAEGISKYEFKPLLASHHTIRTPGKIHVGQTIFVEKASRELL